MYKRILIAPLLYLTLLVAFCLCSVSYGQSTRSAMETSIRHQSRIIADTFAVSNAAMHSFLNDAVVQTDFILRGYKRLDTIWTVAGTSKYSLNSDCYHGGVRSARVLYDSTLGVYREIKSILTQNKGESAAGDGSGLPTWYSQFGLYLTLDPTPQMVSRVELEYEARPWTYSDNDTATVSAIRPEYEQSVKGYVRYLILQRFNLSADAQGALAEWKQSLADIRALTEIKPDVLVSPPATGGQQ